MHKLKQTFGLHLGGSLVLMFAMMLAGCQTMGYLALNRLQLTQFAVENDKLFLMGILNSKTLGQFEQIMSENPNVKTVVLTASGGSIDDETTFKFGRQIRQRGLDTYLLHNSVIASGAVDLFLSGVNRTIEEGAQIGVHSWSDGTKQAKDIAKNHSDHDLNSNYIKDVLGNDDFYWYTIYAADADKILWMDVQKTKQYGLATSRITPSELQPPFNEEFLAFRFEVLEY